MIWSIGTMIMTVIHHLYGAIKYDEPFRLHVAIFAIPVILILMASYLGHIKTPPIRYRNLSLTIFLAASILFSVGAIGVYEGGYNHVLKNILYFGGTSRTALDKIYPSIYELPNDIFFEATGILQFVTGLLCGLEIYKFLVRRKSELLNDAAWRKTR